MNTILHEQVPAADMNSLAAGLEHARLTLEGRLDEAQAKLRVRFAPKDNVPEERVAEGIRLRTQVEKLNWALEMLPTLTPPCGLTVEYLVKEISVARDLFRNRMREIMSALEKGDLSHAQFPRVGDDALTELTTSIAVLFQVLEIVPDTQAATTAAAGDTIIG
jgi:hypothetical protein